MFGRPSRKKYSVTKTIISSSSKSSQLSFSQKWAVFWSETKQPERRCMFIYQNERETRPYQMIVTIARDNRPRPSTLTSNLAQESFSSESRLSTFERTVQFQPSKPSSMGSTHQFRFDHIWPQTIEFALLVREKFDSDWKLKILFELFSFYNLVKRYFYDFESSWRGPIENFEVVWCRLRSNLIKI